MEFNVKKLVGDAGTLFTRAVQVFFCHFKTVNRLCNIMPGFVYVLFSLLKKS